MSKLSRSEQARRNGARSKGPTTQEGLDRCRQVNLTHGSYAAKLSILPHEDAEGYAALFAAAMDQFAPANAFECDLVHNMVDHKWRMSRLQSLATLEIQRTMMALKHNSPAGMTQSELQLRAELESPGVERLERRARYHAREMQRIVKLLTDLRKNKTTSVGTSQIMNKMLDQRSAPRPSAPPPPPAPAPVPPESAGHEPRKGDDPLLQ
jgi:hypothetical protein